MQWKTACWGGLKIEQQSFADNMALNHQQKLLFFPEAGSDLDGVSALDEKWTRHVASGG